MASDLQLFGRGAKPKLLLVQGDSCRTEMCCGLRFATDEVQGGRMTPITFSAAADRVLADWDIELEAGDSWLRRERGVSLFPECDTGSFPQIAPSWNDPWRLQHLAAYGTCEVLPHPALRPSDGAMGFPRRQSTANPDVGEKLLLGALHALHEALDAKDSYTSHHSLRVSAYAGTIARKLKLTDREVSNVGLGARLHDVGKMSIDSALVKKPGVLAPEERTDMECHAEYGYRILSHSNRLEMAAELALAHHEKWDGSGYPKGLAREDIPLAGRILALGDVYDALADKYLAIGCSCVSPNDQRLKMLSQMVEEYQVDGVVDVILQACHTYAVESLAIKRHVRQQHNIPYIAIETDYSTSDVGQLSTRVAAFIEML
ncbi:MAG: 2-hydroxyacyl-CoA dehydratase [Gemmatimonadetes bacterium]|nr:2-hydroxyacyl-CoA dehydratase [Gemmatimonadota bacterium]